MIMQILIEENHIISVTGENEGLASSIHAGGAPPSCFAVSCVMLRESVSRQTKDPSASAGRHEYGS